MEHVSEATNFLFWYLKTYVMMTTFIIIIITTITYLLTYSMAQQPSNEDFFYLVQLILY